jgi:putative NADPH-quinone reductase
LLLAQEQIKWAEHIVIIHPVWWGSMPAKLKGFFDRVFLPGFAFEKKPNSVWWDKLLVNKTARIITTMDQPGWYYRFRYGRPSYRALKDVTLNFSGIHPVKSTMIGPLRESSKEYRMKMLRKVKGLGENL